MDAPGSTIFRRIDGCSDQNTCGTSVISFYLVKDGSDRTCTTTDLESGKNSCFAKSAKQKVSGGNTDKAVAFNQTSTYSVSSEGYIYSRGKSYKQLEVPVTPETDLANQYDTPYLYNILCPSGVVQNDRIRTYYRPSNTPFSTNNAVASSTRLAKLKYNAIACNYSSQNTVRSPAFASEQTAGQTPGEMFLRTEKASQCFRNSVKKTSGRSRFDCSNYVLKPDSSVTRTACLEAQAIARSVASETDLILSDQDLLGPISELLSFLRSAVKAFEKEHANNLRQAEREMAAFSTFASSLGRDLTTAGHGQISPLIDELAERRDSIGPADITYTTEASEKLGQLEELFLKLVARTESLYGRDSPMFSERSDDRRTSLREVEGVPAVLERLVSEKNQEIKEKLSERDLTTEETLIKSVAGSVAQLDPRVPDLAARAMAIELKFGQIVPSEANSALFSEERDAMEAEAIGIVSSNVLSLTPPVSQAEEFFSTDPDSTQYLSFGLELTYSGATHFYFFFKTFDSDGTLVQNIRVGRATQGSPGLKLLGRDQTGKRKTSLIDSSLSRVEDTVTIRHSDSSLVIDGASVLPDHSELVKVSEYSGSGPANIQVFIDNQPGEAHFATTVGDNQNFLIINGGIKMRMEHEQSSGSLELTILGVDGSGPGSNEPVRFVLEMRNGILGLWALP
jgi:hypothetical protein